MTNPPTKSPAASPTMTPSLVEPNHCMPASARAVTSPAPPGATVVRAVATSPVMASSEPAILSHVARREQRIIGLRSQIGALRKESNDALKDADFGKVKRLETKIAGLVKQLQKGVISLHTAVEKHDRQTDSELLIQLRKVLGSDSRKRFLHFLTCGDYDEAATILRTVTLL
jgi:hypothetical protein